MMVRPVAFAGLLLTAVVAACGGGGTTHSSNPKQIVLTAAQLTQAQPFRMDGTVDESITGPAVLGGSAQEVALNLHFDVESAGRSSGMMGTTVLGTAITVNTSMYDGTVYVSTDGGATYKSAPAGHASSQYGPTSALQYLEAVGTVTDAGPASAGGVAVERYEAQLDPTKATSTLRSALAGTSSSLSQVLGAMQFKSGSIGVGIDHQGRLVAEDGSFNMTVDLGAVQPSLHGQTMDASVKLNAHFYDYGAHIVVTKPTDVTGTLPL